MILLLGGTGAYFLDVEAELGSGSYHTPTTPFGEPVPWFVPDRWNGAVALASRHGWGKLTHSPPFVNSRALMWAAREAGATQILSWNGVGAINRLLQIHDLVCLDGVLDGTKTRPRGFHDSSLASIRPTIEHPFDSVAATALFEVVRAEHPRSFAHGTYACSEGPRLETAAEITAWSQFGADVVGMTLVPEVWLAREVGIPFASLAYVTNYATGIEPAPGAPRFFGIEVAQTCLKLVLATAERLLKEAA